MTSSDWVLQAQSPLLCSPTLTKHAAWSLPAPTAAGAVTNAGTSLLSPGALLLRTKNGKNNQY